MKQATSETVLRAVAIGLATAVLAGCQCATPAAGDRGGGGGSPSSIVLPPIPDGGGEIMASAPGATTPTAVTTTQAGVARRRQVIACSGGTPGIVLETASPAEVMVGQPFEYTITVRNATNAALRDVVVTGANTNQLKVEASAPRAKTTQAGRIQWKFERLEPGEMKQVRVRATATASGSATHCETVTFASQLDLCTPIVAVSPQLRLVKSMPEGVLICNQIPVRLQVANVGTGTARNVRIQDVLPEGLTTLDGQRGAAFEIPSLGPGQAREVAFVAKASRTGVFESRAKATADPGLAATASGTVRVVQPVLSLQKAGPQKLIVGRSGDYAITVGNTGDTAATNLVVQDVVAAGLQLLKASDGGTVAGQRATWRLERLAPRERKTVTVTCRAVGSGRVENTASAAAACAAPVSARARTELIGVPAILLELVDADDPIEVGRQATYIVTATNQGTARGTNIVIACKLEDSMSYVTSTGPTTATLAGQKITFAPLPVLQPGAKAAWQVVVKAVKADDARFTVEMTSDQLSRPVRETEATNLY